MGGLVSVGRVLAGQAGASYTERFLSSLMGLISIFLRPILTVARGRDAGRYRDYGWIRLGVVVMWARDGKGAEGEATQHQHWTEWSLGGGGDDDGEGVEVDEEWDGARCGGSAR